MGNCCDSTERVDISSGTNGTVQATSRRPLYSQHASANTIPAGAGHNPSENVHMTSTAPHHPAYPPTHTTHHTTLSAVEYGLQPDLRYPGDARGVHYQPSDTPPALLGFDFSRLDDEHQPPESAAAEAATAAAVAAAVATTTRTTIAETETTRTQSTYKTTINVNGATSPPARVVSAQLPPILQSTVDVGAPSADVQHLQSISYQPRDVMISYSRSDSAIMREIKDGLEARGVTVWVDQSSIDAGADFLSKIGEAIIDAKFFICILSEKAVRSKYCRDEVALAYVSNTAIYPVNLQPYEHLLPLLDTGLKLQLANYNWTSLSEADSRADNLRTLISTLKAELDDLSDEPSDQSYADDALCPPTPTDASPTPVLPSEGGERGRSPSDVVVTVGLAESGGSGSPVQSPTSEGGPPEFRPVRSKLRERNRAKTTMHGGDRSHVTPEQFWSNQFGVVDYVTWHKFTGAFLEVFKEPVEAMFTADDQQQLLDILRRELEVDSDDRIYKYQLTAFCSVYGDALALWPRVHEQARESFAMREVFNMDSSVRVEAIENLGKFRSAAVIDALRDLLTDPDANVRAVATVSLSRTNANDPVTIRHIMRTLSDKDRLVREAGCLALGHLRARQAIGKLSHLWRNDVISHVREAAAVALHQIGGQEVEDVMRVTRVLAEEIRSLTEAKAS